MAKPAIFPLFLCPFPMAPLNTRFLKLKMIHFKETLEVTESEHLVSWIMAEIRKVSVHLVPLFCTLTALDCGWEVQGTLNVSTRQLILQARVWYREMSKGCLLQPYPGFLGTVPRTCLNIIFPRQPYGALASLGFVSGDFLSVAFILRHTIHIL